MRACVGYAWVCLQQVVRAPSPLLTNSNGGSVYDLMDYLAKVHEGCRRDEPLYQRS